MKEHKLELDKPRVLRYGFKALRLIRLKFGERSIANLMNMPIDEMPAFAWAGMKWDDKSITLEQVEDLLDAAIPDKYTVMEATEIIINAIADQVGIKGKKAPAGETKTELKVEEKAEKKGKKPGPAGATVSSRTPKKQR